MDDTTTPAPTREPSGRFLLRIPPGLHATLRRAAHVAGLSLNEYCARALVTGPGRVEGPFHEAVGRAIELFGDGVVGVLVYGSWARDELARGSDVDLLVALARDVPVTRELYYRWDEALDHAPLEWDSHPVEPHFSHLPDPGRRISALWAEVAVEGLLLFERSVEVSRTLAAIRRRIVRGELERHRTYGHPYWVGGPDVQGRHRTGEP